MPPTDIAYPFKDEELEDAREMSIEGNDTSAYYGASQEYRNYPDERMKPFRAEGGPEAEIEKRAYEHDIVDARNLPNEVDDDEDDDGSDRDEEKVRKSSPRKSARGANPQQSSQEKKPEQTSPGVSS